MAASTITQEMVEGYLDSFELFARECLFVRDHVSKQILPFVFNRPQRIFHAVVEKQRASLGYVRAILDKARRFGGSTYIEGRGYWNTSLHFNVNAFICAHEEDSVDTLFGMAKLFHERNPIKPQDRYSNKKELLFDTKDGKGLKSEYSLACARDTSSGRSQGIHFLHASELAYWPADPDELLDGLLSCISDPKDTEVYLESTGNGYGNRFQKDVFDAYSEGRFPYYQEDGITYAWKRPDSDWVLIFIPWFVHEVYTRAFETEQRKEDFIREIKRKVFNKDLMLWEDSEDVKLQTKYGLSLEQLYWRRWMIANSFKGRVEKFRQEYPATVEESFLSAGSSVYSAELCDMVERQCREPLIVGDVVDRMGETVIRPNVHGSFRVWERPDAEMTYFMTVDSAGGLKESQKVEKREPDPSCIDVWNHVTGVQAGQWHGHIDYDVIADMVEMIGKMYAQRDKRGEYVGLPRACVEQNQHGYTVIADLRKKKYPMYESKPGEAGWSTNTKTKHLMVDGLYEAARDGVLQIRCRETVSEMRTFIDKGGGKYEAESGCHDERVINGGMASQMMGMLPRAVRVDERKRGSLGKSNWDRRGEKRWDGEYQEVFVH